MQLALAVRLTQDTVQEVEQAGIIQMVQQAVTNQLKWLLNDTASDGVPDVRIFINKQLEQLLHSAKHKVGFSACNYRCMQALCEQYDKLQRLVSPKLQLDIVTHEAQLHMTAYMLKRRVCNICLQLRSHSDVVTLLV